MEASLCTECFNFYLFQVIVIAFIIAFILRKHVDDETTFVDMAKIRAVASKYSTKNARRFWGMNKMSTFSNNNASFLMKFMEIHSSL